MELLLINHPLDCPVCDKGGECPLQNQAMTNGRGETRFDGREAHLPQADRHLLAGAARPRALRLVRAVHPLLRSRSPATRSSSCSSAARSSRSASHEDEPFESYFSGNTVQICPVGALTGAAYRFRSRPFDLVSTPGGVRALRVRLRAAHRPPARRRCCAGWPATTRGQRGVELRQGPLGVPVRHRQDRLTSAAGPRRRRHLVADVVAGGARRRRRGPGRARGRRRRRRARRRPARPLEDAYAYAKFARVALGTNDVDFRARPHSAEEAAFLAAHVAGSRPRRRPTPTSRPPRPCCSSASSPRRSRRSSSCGCARRSRKGTRGRSPSRRSPPAGSTKLGGTLLPRGARRRGRGARRARRQRRLDDAGRGRGRPCAQPGAVILVGERLAGVPGALSAPPLRLAEATGARLGLGAAARRRARRARGRRPARRCCPVAVRSPTPRRASTSLRRGASTALPDRCRAATPTAILAAAADGRRSARCVVGGVDPADLPDPAAALAALDGAPASSSASSCAPVAVTERADVVLPGRARSPRRPAPSSTGRAATAPFAAALRDTSALPDVRVLRHARRRDGRRPRPAPTSRGAAPSSPSSAPGTARAPPPRPSRRGRRRTPAAGRGGARDLAPAARPRPAAGRRAVPRRHRRSRRSPGCPPPRPPRSASSTASPVTVATDRGCGHAAARRHRRCPTASSGCRRNSAGSARAARGPRRPAAAIGRPASRQGGAA